MTNRVWIELEEVTEESVEKLNNLLAKLGVDRRPFFFDVDDGYVSLNYTTGADGEFLECPDKGHWLNLDYLSS
jgi:hypothetical protein